MLYILSKLIGGTPATAVGHGETGEWATCRPVVPTRNSE